MSNVNGYVQLSPTARNVMGLDADPLDSLLRGSRALSMSDEVLLVLFEAGNNRINGQLRTLLEKQSLSNRRMELMQGAQATLAKYAKDGIKADTPEAAEARKALGAARDLLGADSVEGQKIDQLLGKLGSSSPEEKAWQEWANKAQAEYSVGNPISAPPPDLSDPSRAAVWGNYRDQMLKAQSARDDIAAYTAAHPGNPLPTELSLRANDVLFAKTAPPTPPGLNISSDDVNAASKSLQTAIDKSNNDSQLDMLQIQKLSGQSSQLFGLFTSVMKAQDDAKKGAIGNIR
jgi:hypothetical protein